MRTTTKKKKSDRGFTLAEKLGYQGLATLVALSGVWLDPEEATRGKTPWWLKKRGIRLGRVPRNLVRRANTAGGSVTVRVQRAVAEGRRDEARRLIRGLARAAHAKAKGQAEVVAALLIGAAILAALLLLPAALQAGQTLLAGLK